MWTLLMLVCLLDQNQGTPLPWEPSNLQDLLQQQMTQSTPSPDPGQPRTSSSSSSSSSSSASSESSQSSEGLQLLRERLRLLENTAVEQTDSSQESSELLQSPSNSSTSLWLMNELVLLGERVGERDAERETGDDSAESRESRRRALLLTFHHLLARPRSGLTEAEGGGAVTDVGGAEGGVGVAEQGGVKGEEAEFPPLVDDSRERANDLTLDSPDHAHHQDHHGNEAGLELGL